MRVLVPSSFHVSSTRDAWLKICKGLAAQGIDVKPFDLMPRVQLFSFLEEKCKRSKREMPAGWTPTTMAYEAITGAALFHDCDWVLIVSPQYLPSEIPDMLRKVGIKTAAYFTECPYEDTLHAPITASHFTVNFVSDLYSVGLFKSFAERVVYLPHSFDPDLHLPPENEDEREDNVVFVGTGYSTRVKFLRQVDWPARLDLYGWWPREWLRHDTALRKSLRSRETTTPAETAEIYRKSAVSFGLHREMRYVGTDESIMDGEAYSLGPRNYELAACRTFQVSDYRPELIDVFGDSVPLYATPQELGAVLKRAFDEPSWRSELAYKQWERAQPYSCEKVMSRAAEALAA
jgi:spore maturation protein CgeB